MKKLQNFYLYSYRLVGFIFLTGLIASIIWYGFSILFFMGNSTWSVPMILSPNQEKVMAHLEHILTFEQDITKNKAEVLASEEVLHHKKTLLSINQQLWKRVNESMAYQSRQYIKASIAFNRLSKERVFNVRQLSQLTKEIQKEDNVIDQELKLGLITKQEALLAHLNSSKLYSSLVDSKASMYDLKKRSRDYAEAAKTLNGSGSSLTSMNKVIKKVELEAQITQLENDISSLQIVIKNLKVTIAKKSQALNSMKHSPYILATKKAITVAFVPYTHLKKVNVGAPIFSCYLDMVLCYKSGYVLDIYKAEEYTNHPIFKSEIKGQLISIQFEKESDAQKKMVFLNSKPLLL